MPPIAGRSSAFPTDHSAAVLSFSIPTRSDMIPTRPRSTHEVFTHTSDNAVGAGGAVLDVRSCGKTRDFDSESAEHVLIVREGDLQRAPNVSKMVWRPCRLCYRWNMGCII